MRRIAAALLLLLPARHAGAADAELLFDRADLFEQMCHELQTPLQSVHVGYGPLHLTSQSPLISLRHGLHPQAPSALGRGRWELRTTATWANLWAWGGDGYFVDVETLHTSLDVGYGLTHATRLGLTFDSRSRFGGEMDGFIQGFHDLFNIGQNHRLEVPREDFSVFVAQKGEHPPIVLGAADRGIYANSVTATLQHDLTRGTRRLPALAVSASVRHHTGRDDIMGSDDWDAGVSVTAARRFGQVYGYLALGYAYFGHETFRGRPMEPDQWNVLTAIEWRYAQRQALTVQYLASEGVLVTDSDFAQPSHEITVGWRAEPVQGTMLEVGLIENLFIFDNSPDFGIHCGLTKLF
jgi:hypothetical protein